ncbi:hypothetical protein FNV43_RR25073 [Rhamnella rubrinervis]|uniref:LRAT domain-containing protein n=1 Tax=Rhamnella rubrinervis TaxID=2594499 RepID=A0A8K0DMZ5_9ROSA|nr:hypothetical protein FNV43_RR25073 [Rhamnella rubrinervis]
MGLLSNKIRKEQLKPGDHIYTWRNGYSYSHHGIYVGAGDVIHLTRAPGFLHLLSSSDQSSPSGKDEVKGCSIEEFLSGGDIYRFEYGVKRAHFLIKRAGTCSRDSSDPPNDVLSRAYGYREKRFCDYNLFYNNCEDFAIYCKTGIKTTNRSKPGRSGQIRFLYAIFLALTLTPYPFLPSGFTRLALVVALYYGFIFELDRGVKKVATEKFGVTMEIGSIERFLPVGEFIVTAVWVLRYYSVAVRITYRIRSFIFPESFDDLLRNQPMIQKLGVSVAVILGAYTHWRFFRSKDYFFIVAGFISGFSLLVAYDHTRGFKLLISSPKKSSIESGTGRICRLYDMGTWILVLEFKV